jgi:hypothetical protein
MTEKGKSYCADCAFYEVVCWEDSICTHPSNIKQKQNWYGRYRKFKKGCWRLNWSNNCTNFESKPKAIKPPKGRKNAHRKTQLVDCQD